MPESLPYENATSGKSALTDMQKILHSFGATKFGVMEDLEHRSVVVQFEWRGRRVTIEASAAGYAAAWLRRHPQGSRSRISRQQYEERAARLGEIAVYSILRDWIKGQITAPEVGMLSFEGAFLVQLLLPSGRTVLQVVTERKMLEGPDA